MKRSCGKMSKRSRNLGMSLKKVSAAGAVRKYEVGSKVAIDPQCNFSGMPHPRYRGRVGTIIGTRGKSYEVEITDGNARKMLVVPAVHLRLIKQ